MHHGGKDGKKDYCSMCSDDGKGGFEESLAEEQTWLRMVLQDSPCSCCALTLTLESTQRWYRVNAAR